MPGKVDLAGCSGRAEMRVGRADETVLEGIHTESLLVQQPVLQRVTQKVPRRRWLLQGRSEALAREVVEGELFEGAELVVLARLGKHETFGIAFVLEDLR